MIPSNFYYMYEQMHPKNYWKLCWMLFKCQNYNTENNKTNKNCCERLKCYVKWLKRCSEGFFCSLWQNCSKDPWSGDIFYLIFSFSPLPPFFKIGFFFFSFCLTLQPSVLLLLEKTLVQSARDRIRFSVKPKTIGNVTKHWNHMKYWTSFGNNRRLDF